MGLNLEKVGGWVISERKFFEIIELIKHHCKSMDDLKEQLYTLSPMWGRRKSWYFTDFVEEDGVNRMMNDDEILTFCEKHNVQKIRIE